jgi:hypothetical protein
MGKKLLIAIFCVFFGSVAAANEEDLVTIEQAVAFGNRIMMDISRGKVQQAWRKVKANSTVPPDRIDAFAADYDKHLLQTIQYFGTAQGVELVDKTAFGRSLLRVTYLVKYEVTSIVWYVYFFRIGNDWTISEFNYDLNSNSLFAVAGKSSGGGENALLMQAWQEKMEARMAKLEQGGGGSAPASVVSAYAIDPSTIKGDNTTAVILMELQARIMAMEEKIKAYENAGERLATMETKVNTVSKQFSEITYQLDLQELAKMRKTIHVLKQQHPFAEFP